MPKRIRIFFIGCPSLDTAAASYLLLSQNSVQKAVQFEIYHFWIFGQKAHGAPKGLVGRLLLWLGYLPKPLSRWADRKLLARIDYREEPAFKKELPYKSWFSICKNALCNYDAWFKISNNTYDVDDCPSIIITDTPIEGGFISFTNEDIGLISTAKWKYFFKPVSALDYVLFSVQRLTMRLAFTNEIGSHYPTRGCVWDYDDHQPDARIAILVGSICHTCEKKLLASTDGGTYADLSRLIDNKWLGDKSIQFSPAAILAKVYKYDLSRSTGLNASTISKFTDTFISELGKVLSDGLKWALVLIITLTLAAYFPTVLVKIKQQLSMTPVPTIGGAKSEKLAGQFKLQTPINAQLDCTSCPSISKKPATAPSPSAQARSR
ncbi:MULTISPECIES: hypothetical protein [unclassified Rhodanobacter]|uniref:hypothetical protein n=1 Tax=unclassified Rhodanobacter TaxID=2621553 RepID=UPI001BE0973E|nr:MULTISPECIES: hypothetical protein [unclassified Rhodanobacter]MBT2145588.1 hypothetical protein [Rhodanobacter sp. LX-99]MBT2149633.1 hypothetical protein [Rhodanobacter sp. LX-100]